MLDSIGSEGFNILFELRESTFVFFDDVFVAAHMNESSIRAAMSGKPVKGNMQSDDLVIRLAFVTEDKRGLKAFLDRLGFKNEKSLTNSTIATGYVFSSRLCCCKGFIINIAIVKNMKQVMENRKRILTAIENMKKLPTHRNEIENNQPTQRNRIGHSNT